jgi:hypothetical protein
MRATRYPLKLQVRYRPIGKRDWHQGSTENISHSGALVRADDPLPVDTRVEFRLMLPVAEPADEHPEVSGLGRVVRMVAPSEHHPRSGFAVAIERYEFLPSSVANEADFLEPQRQRH